MSCDYPQKPRGHFGLAPLANDTLNKLSKGFCHDKEKYKTVQHVLISSSQHTTQPDTKFIDVNYLMATKIKVFSFYY